MCEVNTTPLGEGRKKKVWMKPSARFHSGFILNSPIPIRNKPQNSLRLSPSLNRFTKVTAAILMLCIGSPLASAEIPTELAVRAIVGEAANQGEIGMTAVAEAIRNRGHLRGVFGINRDLSKEPKWVFEKAEKCWLKSAGTNLVNGADHWENVKAFGKPSWSKKMVTTAVIKDHVFFKKAVRS